MSMLAGNTTETDSSYSHKKVLITHICCNSQGKMCWAASEGLCLLSV